jgi:hypothetical protein
MRKGDILECPQCGCRMEVVQGFNWPPIQVTPLHCWCGEVMRLMQSGSESVSEPHGLNKILQAAERHSSKR